MTDREAVEIYKHQEKHPADVLLEADARAYQALQEREERSRGCQICNGVNKLYPQGFMKYCPHCSRKLDWEG